MSSFYSKNDSVGTNGMIHSLESSKIILKLSGISTKSQGMHKQGIIVERRIYSS